MTAPRENPASPRARREPSATARYGVALASVALATGARALLSPVLGEDVPFITYFLAVTLAAWYGGLGPGLTSLLLSLLAAGYYFVPPADSLLITAPSHFVGMLVFLAVGAAIVALNDSLRRARLDAEIAAREATERGNAAIRAAVERERAEVALRESEERLRLALTAGRMGVWDWNIATGELRWSASLEPLRGLAAGAFSGTIDGFRELVHPDDRDLVQAGIERALAGADLFELEFRALGDDGTTRWMAGMGQVVRDEKAQPARMVGVGIDVTERRGAQATASRLAAIVESSEDAIIGKTLDGTITSWNQGAVRLYGYQAAEVIGRSLSLLIPPELASDLPELLGRIARGERVEEHETVRIRRDGQRVLVSLVVSPVKDERGRIVGASAIARDITERKRLELELRERTEQVQTQAEELQAQFEELQLQNDELEEQNRHRNEFLAMLAHELRNPLAPIVAAVEVLRLRGTAEAIQERQWNVIERQARHLARLVDDLLDVSRVTQGKIALRRERVELGSVVEQALHVCGALVEARRHTLHVSISRELIELDADPTRIVQVVCNLLNNAARYTEPGGQIWLTVDVDDLPSPQAVIRVRDTGRGIPREMLPRIFDLFVQGERSLARTEGGLGIGLTLARSLVEQHGGSIEACSDGPGKGSEFIVRLPILDDPQERVPRFRNSDFGFSGVRTQMRNAKSEIANPRRVLLVEDNPDAAETQAEVLELWGCEVRTALTGTDAVRIGAEFAPEVVLVDLGLPDVDGYEVARRLRAGPATRKAVLVALTGYGEALVRDRARAAGFDHYLTKPAEADQLRRLVEGGA